MTKTEKLEQGLLADGYAPCDSRSARKCFTRERIMRDGSTAQHYVWLLTGTLRATVDKPVFSESIAATGLVARLLK